MSGGGFFEAIEVHGSDQENIQSEGATKSRKDLYNNYDEPKIDT